MKYVYFFGNGEADGGKEDRELLGGKGADLGEMARLGVHVPPGFTATTEACRLYLANGEMPAAVRDEVRIGLERLEQVRDRYLGDPAKPLLLSVRSGAVVSMPGMMDTVLDLGCNREVMEGIAEITGDRRFALDTYRRLIQMFTNVVTGLKLDSFEEVLDAAVEEAGVASDAELPPEALETVVDRFLETYETEVGEPFPDDPRAQVEAAVAAVFGSWNTPRARKYRELHEIPDDLGTAANVQTMVFGNFNDRSGSGVAFTRNPATGERRLYGEWLARAQGEDVVAGVRTPEPISAAQKRAIDRSSLEERLPDVFTQLCEVADRLERHYADMLDLEFTIENEELFMLQSRRGKRTGMAAVQIATDLVDEGLVDAHGALRRVDAVALEQLLHPSVDPEAEIQPIAHGLPASPGAATGGIAFSAEEAEERAEAGEEVILVRQMTVADDVGGMAASRGVLTARGGMTSHAAVVARGMGIPCVTGVAELEIDAANAVLSVNSAEFGSGDRITIDGTSGNVYAGTVPLREPAVTGSVSRLMGWADQDRRLGIRANADTGRDARRAREFGAQGIGLCRTEHMFFDAARLPHVRKLVLAQSDDQEAEALEVLEPFQRQDFIELFEAMDGLPVTIRLLDPPLHEFLPEDEDEIGALAEELGADSGRLRKRIHALRGENPMLGHRGVRVGITAPRIYRMQVQAILAAAAAVRKGGGQPEPEIMIPLVADAAELRWIKEHVVGPVVEELTAGGEPPTFRFGAMIETPRACLQAAELAEFAEFFSFGTNDLTQMTYGFSRDDSGEFIPTYQEYELFASDPFQHVDRHGVGRLVQMAVERCREAGKQVVFGVCGEHGGDPESIEHWHELGLDYVSCSPFRVPVARLAAAQAALSSADRAT